MNNTNDNTAIDIVDYIEQYVSLEEKNGQYYGLCPFHSEQTPSFTVSRDVQKWYCFGCKQGGDIIAFAMRYHDKGYAETIQDLNRDYKCDFVSRPLSPILKVLNILNRTENKTDPHKLLDDFFLDYFCATNIPLWEREGIPHRLIQKYQVRLDTQKGRIIYPVYDNYGNLINIKGRTVFENYKELGEPKYINYCKVGELDYLQCYFQNRKQIENRREIIIFEGIKSVMKAESFGFDNCVSSETSRLNSYQIDFLISLRCNIVIAYDNDVDIAHILDNINELARFANVFLVYDENNLLGDKSHKNSPVDCGKEVWYTLYNNKRKVYADEWFR